MDISIIICTYNRSRLLDKTLNSLAGLTAPSSIDWELLVVDNNSSDSTKQLVESFIEQHEITSRYIFEPKQGLSHARNRGISESAGEVIAFIDDDVVLPIDWLMQVDRAFTLYDADVISGKVILSIDQPVPYWLDNELQQCFGAFDRGNEVSIFTSVNDGMVAIGANVCFRKRVFDIVGLFDTKTGRIGKKLLMGEETDLIRRVLNNGGKCVYFPEMFLFHIAESEKISKDYVLRWYFRWGQWEAQCNKYENNSKVQDFRLVCWLFKRIIYDSIKYVKCAILSDSDDSFKTKVNIVRLIGCLSRIY